MLKLQRPTNRPSKQRERFDFKFSNFQALQVPKGWDRLYLSLVSAESGKTIAKLGKTLVKNGSCLWSETISESFSISRYDSSKAYEDCLVKFVVSTSSTRSNNTLGEAIINMAQHAASRTSSAVSQPLKKCSYATILQVKIQRVTPPRSKIRDEGSRSSDSQEKVEDVDHFDAQSKSHRSDDSSTNKLKREELATSSNPLKLDSEEASESATAIINSFSSLEGSYERENSSLENDFKSEENERRVGGSNSGGLLPDHYSVDDDSPSNESHVDPRVHVRENFHNEAAVSRWSMSNVSSSRNLLEAAEDSIEELRAEAKMWERNARKLMIDLDISRKDFSDLSKKQAELGVELSAAYAEQDGLRRLVEEVKEELRLSTTTNKATREAPVVQSRSLQKELENEMRYQHHLNDELGQQLKQSQESNIELVSVLRELEETIERQRIEIENLSSLKVNFMDLQNSMDRSSEENRSLLIQFEQLKESEKNLKSDIQLLDEALRDKTDELEKERESNREILSQVEREYNCKMLLKEKEITSLEEKLSEYIKDEELNGNGEDDVNLMREIESLREKVRELEKDCTELTDENLELLFKLNGSNKMDIRKCSSFESITSEHPTSCPSDDSEVSDPKYQVSNMEEDFKEEVKIEGLESSLHFAEILEQMDIAFHLLMKPCYGRFSGESETSEDYLHRLMISDKVDTTRMSVEHIRNLLHDLNKLLQTRIAESEECISDLEAQVDQLKDEKRECLQEMESYKSSATGLQDELKDEKRERLQEMESYKSSATSLQDEIRELKDETDIQISELRQKSEDIRKQWLKAQEECVCLKAENETLQASAATSVLKTTELQNLNAELKRENQELHERSSQLVHQLSEMEKSLSDCTKKIESLQSHLTSAQDDFVLKENHLKSELDALVKQNSYQKEKVTEEKSLRQLLFEKTTEFQSLEKEVESLRKQLADSHEERERIFIEVSSLQAENAELKASLQESELKLQDLTDQRAASNQSHDRLAADYERILKLVANYRKVEEKLKTDLNDIELKHTISDYERHQLTKEMSSLKVQLQSISDLQEEVSILKSDLKESKLDKGKVELTLLTISRDYEEMKAENISLSEKICVFEDTLSEFEECKRNKSCIEEKLLEMEKDLSAKEILSIQNEELRNEVAEMKRLNVQFQQKMYRLEVEKDECLKKVQALEDNLKLMEERNSIHKEGAHNYHNFHDQDPHVVSGDNLTNSELLEYEFSEGRDANSNNNRFLHERQKKFGGMVARERYERTKSSLETELRDLRERYLQMSLKYAEVEEQREDLVMKLRATRTKKRWFS